MSRAGTLDPATDQPDVAIEPCEARVDAGSLGHRIAGLRRAHGLTQRRLAEVAGVSNGYIALLELGRLPSPGKFRLDAIARALDLHTADALLGVNSDAIAGADLTHFRVPHPPDEPSGLDAIRPEHPSAEVSDAQATEPASSPAASVGAAPLGNVLGAVEALRAPGARALPVFRWGSCGDPRDRESPPDPDRLEFAPPGREMLIGSSGFAVVVKGDSMAGRGINDGDVVWVNPDRSYQVGKVVLALVSDLSGNSGMVVKTYARTEVGECLLSETAHGRTPVVCHQFRVIGPVVGITSWRLPG